MESITLYYRQGSSDKIYQAAIEPKDSKYVVNFAYGRRGTTLQTGTKTSVAVHYDAAKAIYDKLIKEKTSKGYTTGEDGSPYQHTDKTSSGILPQLLNPIEEIQLVSLLKDNDFIMQEKFDGRRLLIQKQGNTITGINKLGLVVALPSIIEQEMQGVSRDCLIDGEIIGVEYHAFDLLSIDGEEYRHQAYRVRYLELMNLMASFCHLHISLVDSAHTSFQKGVLFDHLKFHGKEGVVFKRLDASYTPGRPNSGGSQFKFKFCESASFIVSKPNGKRSVALSLYNGNEVVSVGNVSIPPNKDIPITGEIIEVRYLYAFRGGSIFQPVYLGKRDDISAEECGVDQLKYKAA